MKNKLFVIIMAASMLLGTFAFMLIPDKAFSESERRLLAKMPEISAKSLFSGDFMDGFEVYAQDSFPLRDSFRGLKSRFVLDVLKQGDNNGLYTAMGHIAKGDYPMNEKMLQYAAGRMESIYKRYLEGTDCKLYFSIIPDKNRYIAPGFILILMSWKAICWIKPATWNTSPLRSSSAPMTIIIPTATGGRSASARWQRKSALPWERK